MGIHIQVGITDSQPDLQVSKVSGFRFQAFLGFKLRIRFLGFEG